MKVIKKYFKVVLCFMAFALCSFMFAFTPTLTATYAIDYAMDKYNVAINAIKMPQEEVDYNDPNAKFRIPLLNSVLGNIAGDGVDDDKIPSYTIRVVDPSGHKHNYVVGANDNDTKFFNKDLEVYEGRNHLIVNAKNDGEYKVIYILEQNDREYYSNSYKVTVKNVSYELDFSTPVLNSNKEIVGYTKNLLKSKLAVSTTPYEIPVAYAKKAGEELSINSTDGSVTNLTASIKVTKDGAPQEIGAEGSIFTTSNGKFYITPSSAGVYTVEYTYENSANRPTKTFTINVENGFEAENLKLASTPTMPTIELGKEDIKLPTLTFNAGSEKNVDVNVKSIVIEKETDSNIKCVLENNNFEFDMTVDMFNDFYTGTLTYADMAGNYRITYTVEDAYGKTKTETFKVDGVTASSKPSIYLAYNYDKTKADFQDKVVLGAETELKAEYVSTNEIVLPAVYVEDAVTTDYDDFIIIRTIRKGSTYYYVDNYKYNENDGTYMVDANKVASSDKSFNASGDTNIGDVTKAVKFKFNTNAQNVEGTYYVEYRVISKEVKERENNLYVAGTTEKYTFKVVSSHEKTEPTVEITNLKDSSIKNTDDITVKVSSKDDLDTRLKNAVFTYTATKSGATTLVDDIESAIGSVQGAAGYEKTCHIFDDEKFVTAMQAKYEGFAIVKENEETKNSFDLNLKGKTGTVYVVAAAINDDGNVDVDEKELTIKDTSEITPPTISIYEASNWVNSSDEIIEKTYGQGVDVKLPTVYAVDFNEAKDDIHDKTLSLNVMYYIDSPENSNGAISYKSPTGKAFTYGEHTISGTKRAVQFIDGGTITTSETGVYYVVYTATDVAGNTSVMYFSFVVEDTSKPILSVEAVGNDITRSGNTVEGGKGTVIDFETTIRSADGKTDYSDNDSVEITIDDDGKGLDYQPSGNSKTSYVFNDYGTYVVTITGSNDNGVEADSKVIKVNIVKQEIKWLGEFDVTQYAGKNKEVKLPDIAASNDAVVTVSVTAPGGSAPIAGDAKKVTDENGYTYWSFTTNEDSKGTYTVTYTATNDEDVLTKTFSIKVGDNVAPTLTFKKGELTQDLVYDGENDIEYVVEVNKTKTTSKDRYFIVKVINNGKEVYSQNIGLKITDKDDTGRDTDMSWTNLSYELTGPSVKKGETTSNSTQYLISGTGKYALTLTIKDSYDNVRTETINFNVVTESSVEENKDTVVGAVLIVISLILLAGVIVFFLFTGKKGGKGTVKTKKVKAVKTENKDNEEVEKTEEIKAEVVEEKVETEKAEEVSEVETKVDEEPKSGDVE